MPARETAALLALALCCAAQNEPPVFRTTTKLVEFTVVALDRKGHPLTDLKKGEFAIFDNGKPRAVAFFRYEGGAAPAETKTQSPGQERGVFTNRVEVGAAQPRNVTALVLDMANTEPNDQMFVKAQSMQFLRAFAPRTRVAVFEMGREFRVIHDYTDDMESLREQLANLKIGFPAQKLTDVERMAREAEEMIAQIEVAKSPYRTYMAPILERAFRAAMAGEVNFNTKVHGGRVAASVTMLEALGRHLAGIRGRKSIVWISGGLAMTSPSVDPRGAGRVNPTGGENFEKAIRAASERLAQAGVTLYAVDARGLTSPSDTLADRQYPAPVSSRFDSLERAGGAGMDSRAAFTMLTEITGGRFFFNSNDFSEGIRKAEGDLEGSYSIGFYAAGETDTRWHTLKVSTTRAGVDLVHRKGYLSEAAPTAPFLWNADSLKRAMLDPDGSSAIHMTARCEDAPGAAAGTLRLTLQIDASDLTLREERDRRAGEFEVVVGERSAGGKVKYQQETIRLNFTEAQWEAARAKGLPYRRTWKPDAGAVTIRVLVRDTATSNAGTLDIPIAAIHAP